MLLGVLLGVVSAGALAGATPSPIAAQDWIGALAELRLAPADLRDARSPIEQRIALAEALGRYGPAEPAIAALSAALRSDPEPPARLRAAILRALALRSPAHVPEPLASVLRSADARTQRMLSVQAQAFRASHAASSASPNPRSPAGDSAWLALAIRLRSAGPDLSDEDRAVLARLRVLPKGRSRLLLRALARDAEVLPGLVEQLSASDPRSRAYAAQGGQWLGDPRIALPLATAFARETDPEALRAMSAALASLRVVVAGPALAALERALCEPIAAPDALVALVLAWQRAPHLQERLQQRLRAALAGSACKDALEAVPDDDPRSARLRVAAALSLGRTRDPEALPALRAALLSPFARVRLSAAIALRSLGTTAACQTLALHARLEPSPLVRAWLPNSPKQAQPEAQCSELDAKVASAHAVLQLRVVTPGRPYDVLLADGRWLRVLPLPSGDLIVPDLPHGRAEARLAP